jgi:phage baseplate assembly protein W
MDGIGPQLPLTVSTSAGAYALITSYQEQVKQNFKNLLLTSPGERMMNPDFGVGMRSFLFEPKIQAVPAIRQRITRQVRKYMPFIQINKIKFDSGENLSESDFMDSPLLSINIEYTVPSLNLNTTLILQNEDTI